MGLPDEDANNARRFFIGIGVGTYDDAALNLPKAESDVVEVADWFTRRSGVAHSHALANLGKSPKASEISSHCGAFSSASPRATSWSSTWRPMASSRAHAPTCLGATRRARRWRAFR